MFEEESKEYANKWLYHVKDLELHHKEDDKPEYTRILEAHQKGAELGYNKANEWHYVKDGDLPRQDGNTCFSIEVLASNKKWVYYQFDSGKWFCGNKEVNVIAWKEIVFPELKEIENEPQKIVYPIGAAYYQYGDKTPNELFPDTVWEYQGIIQGMSWWVRVK